MRHLLPWASALRPSTSGAGVESFLTGPPSTPESASISSPDLVTLPRQHPLLFFLGLLLLALCSRSSDAYTIQFPLCLIASLVYIFGSRFSSAFCLLRRTGSSLIHSLFLFAFGAFHVLFLSLLLVRLLFVFFLFFSLLVCIYFRLNTTASPPKGTG